MRSSRPISLVSGSDIGGWANLIGSSLLEELFVLIVQRLERSAEVVATLLRELLCNGVCGVVILGRGLVGDGGL